MKTILVAGLLLCVGPGSLLAQGGAVGVRERAKEIVRQNNVRQGVPTPAQPPTPAAPATPPTTPTPAVAAPKPALTAQQSVAKISSDLATFKPATAATTEQKQQLLKDIAMSFRGKKASLPTVQKFVDSLALALNDATLEAEQQTRLATDIEAIVNGAGMPADKFDAVVKDIQDVLQVGRVKRNVAMAVAADAKAIGDEVRR